MWERNFVLIKIRITVLWIRAQRGAKKIAVVAQNKTPQRQLAVEWMLPNVWGIVPSSQGPILVLILKPLSLYPIFSKPESPRYSNVSSSKAAL